MLSGFYPGQTTPPPLAYSVDITAADLSRHLHVLASDEYEGRETGKEGQKRSAAYIAGEFRKSGVPPLFNMGYYQQFPLAIQLPNKVDITLHGKKYQPMKDYYFFPGLEKQTVEVKEVTFLGFGVSDDKYDDYKGRSVKDKVVLILEGEPMTKDSVSVITGAGEVSDWSGYWRRKIETAAGHDVKALVVAVENVEKNVKDHQHHINTTSMKLVSNTKERTSGMAVIYISKQMADEMLKSTKKTTSGLRKSIGNSKKPEAFPISTGLGIYIDEQEEEVVAENVLGYIEGSDLKDEVIVISAHYDHLGKKDGVVYNGADDDGSGTVALIEMAAAFARAKAEGKGPRRSLLFIGFAGEEKGLLGSKYYTQNPVFPLAKTIANLNIDMIGRIDEAHQKDPDYIYIIGPGKQNEALLAVNEEANKKHTNLKLDYTFNDLRDRNRFYYRSDHYNFAKNEVPVLFYFNGTHADYHKETDEISKIDFGLIEKRTRLVFFTAWELASRNESVRGAVKPN